MTASENRPLIDISDPRTAKALAIVVGASGWLRCRTHDGQKLYGVPSQTKPGLYYLTSMHRCGCADFVRRQQPCKHIVAVQLWCTAVRTHHSALVSHRPGLKAA